MNLNQCTIAIIGLGYVGLPLAVEFGKTRSVIGFDTNKKRVEELEDGIDHTLEVSQEVLKSVKYLKYSTEMSALKNAQVYIVTVPTPIDSVNRPDLSFLEKASETVGKSIKKGDVVIYESTVYPGCTEEFCVPVLEKNSGLKFNQDFYCGYSPERINPGDKINTLTKIKKVTSGSTQEVADAVDSLYASIITAGTHKVANIKVAEACKVIENTQRDLNIALVNELSVLFNRLGIDTIEALEAAGTKRNFLPFRPGMVGGHCIGVDPYYLTHKAEQIGHHPQVILAGRRMNDGMGAYVAGQFIKASARAGLLRPQMRVLVLGLAFKENCPDLRNTRVVDVIEELEDFGASVDVFDPEVSSEEAASEYGIDLVDAPEAGAYDGVILAVPHRVFVAQSASVLRSFGRGEGHVFFDLKSVFAQHESDIRL